MRFWIPGMFWHECPYLTNRQKTHWRNWRNIIESVWEKNGEAEKDKNTGHKEFLSGVVGSENYCAIIVALKMNSVLTPMWKILPLTSRKPDTLVEPKSIRCCTKPNRLKKSTVWMWSACTHSYASMESFQYATLKSTWVQNILQNFSIVRV